MKKRHPEHTTEYKDEAVRLATQSNTTIAQTARNLGIPDHLLYKWVAQGRKAPHNSPSSNPPTNADDVQRLRAELKRVTEERDFLKKASAFFAKEIK